MNILRVVLAGLFSLGITLTSSAQSGSEDPPAKQTPAKNPKGLPAEAAETIRVPMTMLPSRHFLVKVMIEGKGPFQLILDTGAPLTIVNSKTAKAAGLTKKEGGGGIFDLFGGVNQVNIGKLQVGDVIAEKSSAVIMDHPTVAAISDAFKKEHGAIDGIVGFPFFARYAMTVDYQKKELLFKANGYKPGDYLNDIMNSMTAAIEKRGPKILVPQGLWGFSVDKDSDDQAAGVVVKQVLADGPAGKAGLKVGDRLLTLDSRWTDSLADTLIATSLVKPGKSATLVVMRGKNEMNLMVTPVVGR